MELYYGQANVVGVQVERIRVGNFGAVCGEFHTLKRAYEYG